MNKSILVFCFAIFSFHAFAQKSGKIDDASFAKLKEFEDTLGLCGFLVINDSLPEERFASCKKLITTLKQALKVPNSFNYPFDQVKSVSIQYPADSTFRIFTWQLYVDVDDYRYYGAIQMNTPDLQLFPLIDRSVDVQSEEQDVLKPETWYGALYYNTKQFDTPTGRKYLLFGYDGFSFDDKRKLVDVLSFQNGKPVFGAPVFVQLDSLGNELAVRNRLLFEYSAEASFKMNYDESYGLILFDHLITRAGSYGQGPTMVPDGTYEGYQLKNGRWEWVEKYWTQVMDEAPRPEPVLDSRHEQDVFGKQKKKKKKS
ncbi:MAG: hypothetical protein IT258_16310 [Saprospiraceae bacterium]|nr:hypothetical protein [Saprospiraceae bacterium]